jgi:hypothetical protein
MMSISYSSRTKELLSTDIAKILSFATEEDIAKITKSNSESSKKSRVNNDPQVIAMYCAPDEYFLPGA